MDNSRNSGEITAGTIKGIWKYATPQQKASLINQYLKERHKSDWEYAKQVSEKLEAIKIYERGVKSGETPNSEKVFSYSNKNYSKSLPDYSPSKDLNNFYREKRNNLSEFLESWIEKTFKNYRNAADSIKNDEYNKRVKENNEEIKEKVKGKKRLSKNKPSEQPIKNREKITYNLDSSDKLNFKSKSNRNQLNRKVYIDKEDDENKMDNFDNSNTMKRRLGNLEKFVGNFGKGTLVGLTRIADPIGTSLSGTDYLITGVGYSDERALDTIHNKVCRTVYNKPEEKISFGTGYVPRAIGNIAGGSLAAVGLFGLYKSFGWVAAATIPFLTGVYDAFNSIKKYISDFGKGEQINGEYKKGSFYDGFRYGWHSGTHLFIDDLHELETSFTGRSVNQSRLDSSMRESSKNMRRNFSSVAGRVLGGLTGGVVSLLTLGILPLYKSVRDTVRTIKK
ncbi:MAG: hypothetical protein ABIE36_00480 [Candidatus Diapherotrites archaeon]